MITKNKLCLLLACVLAINVYGQSQQSRWFNFQPSMANPTCVDFTQPTPTTSTLPSNWLTEYRGYNAAFDDKGNLVFYVIAQSEKGFVYNANGVLVKTIIFNPLQPSPSGNIWGSAEIPIIKIGCGLLYHFIIGNFIYQYDIVTGTVTPVLDNGSSVGFGSVNIANGGLYASVYNSSYAISKKDDYKYAVYYLDANRPGYPGRYLQHAIVDAKNITNEMYNSVSGADLSLGPNGYTTAFQNYISVLELSPTKNYIAFAEEKFVFVYNILSNGSIGTLKGTYEFESLSSIIDYKVAGLEFTPDGQKLYFTRFDRLGAATNDALGYIDLSATTPMITYVSGTSVYGRSEIELGRDNNLYVTTPTKLVKINTTTNTFIDVLTLNFYPNSKISQFLPVDNSIRVLPDQIDGVNNSDGFTVKATNYATTANATWTNGAGSNPFGVVAGQNVTVKTRIRINHVITVTNMNFDFFEDADIYIASGGKLILRSCNLKGFDCGKMWKGITVSGTGQLLINDNMVINGNPSMPSTVPSSIADAKLAISSTGAQSTVQINQTNFLRNGQNAKLVSCDGTKVGFNYCSFNNNLPVKNQDATSGGYYMANYLKWYGGKSVEVSSMSISWLYVGNCEFIGGTVGVLSGSAPLVVTKCNFRDMANHKGIGVQASSVSAKPILVTNGCLFKNVQKALEVTNGGKVEFSKNKVDMAITNGVELNKGKNCNYTITGNTFIKCRNNAILLQDNAGVSSVCNISGNNITGYQSSFINGIGYLPSVGISVFEKGKIVGIGAYTFGGSYVLSGITVKGLQITNNIMTKVTHGIKMSNVVGGQTIKPSPLNQTNITGNSIQFMATFTPLKTPPVNSDYNGGIQLVSCDGIAVHENPKIENTDISLNKRWHNMGVELLNTTNVLVKANTIKAGRGIATNEKALLNNYACNTFLDNYDGISLGNHFMRTVGDYHGVLAKESRENFFTAFVHSNIEVYATPTWDPIKKVTVSASSRLANLIPQNQWLFLASPVIIKYEPSVTGTTSIHAGVAPGICGNQSESSTGIAPGIAPNSNTSDVLGWQMQYEYIKQQKLLGQPVAGFINSLIEVEAAVSAGEYAVAQSLLGQMNSENPIENYYKTVYALVVNTQLPEERLFNEVEIQTLTGIAKLVPIEAGPAVYLARGILWCQEGLEFRTEPDRNRPIMLKLNYESCLSELPVDAIVSKWVDANGVIYSDVKIEITDMGIAFIPATESMQVSQSNQYAFQFTYQNNVYTSTYLTLADWITDPTQEVTLCGMGKRETYTQVSEQAETKPGIKVYPNPSTGLYQLQGEYLAGLTATILDRTGKIIYQATLEANGIDLTEKAEGIYYLRLTDSTGKLVHQQSILKTK